MNLDIFQINSTHLSQAESRASQLQQHAKMWLVSPSSLVYSQQHRASLDCPARAILPRIYSRKTGILTEAIKCH